MEKEGNQSKEELARTAAANSEHSSVNRSCETSVITQKCSSYEAQNLSEKFSGNSNFDKIPLDRSQTGYVIVTASVDTLQTSNSLGNPPNKHYIDVVATSKLVGHPGRGSSSQINTGSEKVFDSKISGKVELFLTDSSNDEISIIKRIVNNNSRISNVKHLDNLGSTTTVWREPHSPQHHDVLHKARKSYHNPQAIYENKQNNYFNNNNNDKSADVSPCAVDDRRTKSMGNEMFCNQVSQMENEKIFFTTESDILGAQVTTINSRPIATNTNVSDKLKEHVYEPSVHKTQPVINLTMNKFSIQKSFDRDSHRNISTHKITDTQMPITDWSPIEPEVLVKTNTSGPLKSGHHSGLLSSFQRTSEVNNKALLLKVSAGSSGCQNVTPSSSSSETQSTNRTNENRDHSLQPSWGYKEKSDCGKNTFMISGKKTAPDLPNSIGYLKVTNSPVTLINPQSITLSTTYPHQIAQKSIASTMQQFSQYSQLGSIPTPSIGSKDSTVTSIISTGNIRNAAPAKKSRSRSSKQKSKKPSFDDEDDNIDFIPVGMLQLSATNRPEVSSPNVDRFVVENNLANQLTVGSYLMTEKQNLLKQSTLQSLEKPYLHEKKMIIQEKLKEKLVDNKELKQAFHVKQDVHNERFDPGNLQQHKSQDQHQLLLKLVQHAQQKQQPKPLHKEHQHSQLDEDQHVHQSHNFLNLANSSLAEPTNFSKNQGLIIHQQQPKKAHFDVNIKTSSVDTIDKGNFPTEHSRDHTFRIVPTPEPKTQQLDQAKTNVAKNDKPQVASRYYSQLSSSRGHQLETATIKKDPQWENQSSSIPKIAERLLQQSLIENMMISRGELSNPEHFSQQLLAQQAHKQPPSTQPLPTRESPRQGDFSKCDQLASRPMTPTTGHPTAPSVNQQHPEIARMLNSPVSPRQSVSPRLSVSPRHIASPVQLTSISAQHRQVSTPQFRKSSGQNISSSTNATTVSLQSSNSFTADQRYTTSLHQGNDTFQAVNTDNSSSKVISGSHFQPCTDYTISGKLSIDKRCGEQTRVDLQEHKSGMPYEIIKFTNSGQPCVSNTIIQMAADGQLVSPAVSVSLPHSNAPQISCPISANQSAQPSVPGQVIHYRPQEHKHPDKNAPTALKSHSPISIHLSAATTVPLTTTTILTSQVQVPSVPSSATVWRSSQIKSTNTAVAATLQLSQSSTTDTKSQQSESHCVNDLTKEATLPATDATVQQQMYKTVSNSCSLESSPISHNQGTEKLGAALQLHQSADQNAAPKTTQSVTEMIKSFVESNVHGRDIQSNASLLEKESSLIQYLFSNNFSAETNEVTPFDLGQTSSQRDTHTSSASLVDNSDEGFTRIYPNVASSYREMRHNEGGLKVLSEIASKRYQLAVAGKEDTTDLHTPQLDNKQQSSAAKSELSEVKLTRSKQKKKKSSTSYDQKDIKQDKVSQKLPDNEGTPTNTYIKLRERRTKDASAKNTEEKVSQKDSEQPPREARQRKPKKPFEHDDDTPIKRSQKSLHPNNSNIKKDIFLTSVQNSLTKKGQSQINSQPNLTESEERKKIITRQTRSAADKAVDGKKTSQAKKKLEDVESTEPLTPRRLSKRLLMKDNDQAETQNNSSITKSRKLSRQPTLPNLREKGSDTVNESISSRIVRSGRHASISSADGDTTERMNTRSTNKINENKATKGGNKISILKENARNLMKKKKLALATKESTEKKTAVTTVNNKINTRNQLKSPSRGLQLESPSRELQLESPSRGLQLESPGRKSQSPVKPIVNSPPSKRKAAREALAKLGSSKPGKSLLIRHSQSSKLLKATSARQTLFKQLMSLRSQPKALKSFVIIKKNQEIEKQKLEYSELTTAPETRSGSASKINQLTFKKKKHKMNSNVSTSKSDLKSPDYNNDFRNMKRLTVDVINTKVNEEHYGSQLLNKSVIKSQDKANLDETKKVPDKDINKATVDGHEQLDDSKVDMTLTEKYPGEESQFNSQAKKSQHKSVVIVTPKLSPQIIKTKAFVQSRVSAALSLEGTNKGDIVLGSDSGDHTGQGGRDSNVGSTEPSGGIHTQPSSVGHTQPDSVGHTQPSSVDHIIPDGGDIVAITKPGGAGHTEPDGCDSIADNTEPNVCDIITDPDRMDHTEPTDNNKIGSTKSTGDETEIHTKQSIDTSVCRTVQSLDKDDTQQASGREKMVMYKLVPISDEDSMPNIHENLVPITGYLIQGVTSDCILLSHDSLLRHNKESIPMSCLSSTSIAAAVDKYNMPPSKVTGFERPRHASLLEHKPLSGHERADPPSLLKHVSLSSQLLTCSSQAMDSYSNMASTISLSSACLPAHSSTDSAAGVWAQHLPQTPPLSTGSPSSIVFPKKSWTSAQTSQLQNRLSSSWNTTPPSSSSSLPSSSAWSSSSPPSLPSFSHQQNQPWIPTSQQTPQECTWSLPSSVTAAAIESWSKEFFPGTILVNTLSQRLAANVTQSCQTHNITSTAQIGQQNIGYNVVETGALVQQTDMFTSSSDPTVSSSMLFNAGPSHDSEYPDSKQDSMIHGLIKQVSSAGFNSTGYSQELAGFNLGQQDLAYLENRLRQSLSPNTLFSAVAAYEDNSGHGAGVGHDNSLHESINLVHTVNLDMEEAHLAGTAHLDLVHLSGSTSVPELNVSRNVDGPGANRNNQEAVTLSNVDNPTPTTHKSDMFKKKKVKSGELSLVDKKTPRERKSQYEIIIKDDVKRYQCLLCGKNFGVATIYRHLRIHDADYKVSCSHCDKQFTQRQSLAMHCWKVHGIKAKSAPLDKDQELKGQPSSDEKTPTEFPDESPQWLKVPLKSLDTDVDSQNMSLKCTDAQGVRSSNMQSPDIGNKLPVLSIGQQEAPLISDPLVDSQLSRQQVTHNQVEELRKWKAENKLAASQKKVSADSVHDGGSTPDEGPQDTRKFADGLTANKRIPSQTDSSRADFEHSSTWSASQLPVGTDSSRSAGHFHDRYGSPTSMKPPASFISNNSKVPQFHASDIPKPIITATIAGSLSSRVENLQKTSSSTEEEVIHEHTENGENKYVCDICNTKLNTKNSYTLHLRRHNIKKTKLCSYCDKSFLTGQELRSHERTHTGERPYKCDICQTSFAHSGSFVSHKRGHDKRGETSPFPIVNGNIQYPSTFKKPRLSGVDSNGNRFGRIGKSKKKKPASDIEDAGNLVSPQNANYQQASVIRRHSVASNLTENLENADNFDMSPTNGWHNVLQPQLTTDSLQSQIERRNISDHNLISSSLGLVGTPQERMSPEVCNKRYPSGDSYLSPTGNNTMDYYSSSSEHSLNVQQHQGYNSNPVENSSTAFYSRQQDKYYSQTASDNRYPSHNQANSEDLARVKNQNYTEPQSYSQSGTLADEFYPPQHQSSDSYHYKMSLQNENTDFNQAVNYEDSLGQYKSDPSSSEIVKKLLQHYNVAAATIQETAPLDFSHHMQNAHGYSTREHSNTAYRVDTNYSTSAPPPYRAEETSHTTSAPPPYTATRITSQAKDLYTCKPGTLNYKSIMPQTSRTPDQPGNREIILQPHQVQSEQFGTSSMQGHSQDIFSSESKYSLSKSLEAMPTANPALSQKPGPQFYIQPLPQFETLARESSPSQRK